MHRLIPNFMNQICPLCSHPSPAFYWQDKRREYWQCSNCELVFVPKAFHLSRENEKAEYDKHENNLDDCGYVKFLSRLANPLLKCLSEKSRGIDFGCGPAPALAKLLEQQGHSVALYDLLYYS